MHYEALTAQEQAQLINERLHQLEAEHFSRVLTRRASELATDVPADARDATLRRLDEEISTLDAAIMLHREDRDALLEGHGLEPAQPLPNSSGSA